MNSDETVGELVLRFRYPDGRLSALITVEGDWKVEVFANEDAARQFAKEHNLKVKEIENADPT
jgi:hypothetical protein